MIHRSWGVELWDQFDNVNKYNDRTVQFYEKYESFLKDRCTIEDDYARALKKLTKTYTPKPKEQEEFYNKFTFTMTFCATIKELHDLASQHELIAESIRERPIKQIQTTIKECREQRKKYLDEYQRIKRQLDKQYELLIKSLRKYEECFDSSRRAKENFEKAHEDLDLSRAQLEKARDMMNFKAKLSDDAHNSYSSQVASYNESQRLFYERQLPTILSDLQLFDGKHSDDLKHNYRHFIQAHAEVLPRIQACLDEMSKQTEQISSMADAQTVIEEYKTGYAIPEDHQPVDLNIGERPSIVPVGQEQPIYDELTRSNTLRSTNSEQSSATTIYAVGNANVHVNGTQTLMPGSENNHRKRSGKASTIRKIFGSSNQRKSSNGQNSKTTAHDIPHGNLPPAQRLKKFQEHILNCKNDLDKQQKAREGLLKMKVVFQENPKFGDEHDVAQQILSMDEQIDRLFAEIKRYEIYIAEVERTQYPALSDTESSSRSRKIYGSNQSINNDHYRTFLHKRSSLYFASHHMKFLNFNRRWSTMVCSPDQFQSSHSTSDNIIYDQSVISSSNEYHCLPSVTSLTLDPTARTADLEQQDDPNGSFEDDDQSITTEYQSLRREPSTKAYALYDFNGHGIDGCQYANAATISTGECVTILEDDQGDGWTRIEKINGSTGFVPSSYLRLDSQLLSAPFESNRF